MATSSEKLMTVINVKGAWGKQGETAERKAAERFPVAPSLEETAERRDLHGVGIRGPV